MFEMTFWDVQFMMLYLGHSTGIHRISKVIFRFFISSILIDARVARRLESRTTGQVSGVRVPTLA